MVKSTALVSYFTAICAASVVPDPIVHLDHGALQGKFSEKYNITFFRRIPFAAPPIGNGRFNVPQQVQPWQGLYNTDQDFPMCPQGRDLGSEDCLYLGLYSRPWVPGSALRPVVVFIHGGGWTRGGGGFSIPPPGYPTLNVSNLNDFVLVYPNHRLNVFGLLPGKKIKNSDSAVLNPTLLDQEYALKWVQQHIAKFGGDPNSVTIWGQSAGGGGVIAQVLGQSRTKTPKLFNKAVMSSPYFPRTYHYSSPEAEKLYKDVTTWTGCDNKTDSLQCLKTVDVKTLQFAAWKMGADYQYTTSTFTWAPVIDDTFLVEPLTSVTTKGDLSIDLAYGVYNSHEGESFVPHDLEKSTSPRFNSSTAGFETWLRGFLPNFNETLLEHVKQLYPNAGKTETFTFDTAFTRAGVIYLDLLLACPTFWLSNGAKKGGWMTYYDIPPGLHALDTVYWGMITTSQKTKKMVYEAFAGAFASFIQTGNPSSHLKAAEAIPRIDSGNMWRVQDGKFGLIDSKYLQQRCKFWQTHGQLVPV